MTPSNAMSMSREGYEYLATSANSVRERFGYCSCDLSVGLKRGF
jgi:hypothetical protein